MVERGQQLRLAREARSALRIGDEDVGQDLDRDVAIELRIASAIDLAHSAGPKRAEDLVRTEARAGGQRHAIPSSPWCNSIVAPRTARRPAGKARRPRISGIFEGGATQPAGDHHRSNADGVAPRTASPLDGLARSCIRGVRGTRSVRASECRPAAREIRDRRAARERSRRPASSNNANVGDSIRSPWHALPDRRAAHRRRAPGSRSPRTDRAPCVSGLVVARMRRISSCNASTSRNRPSRSARLAVLHQGHHQWSRRRIIARNSRYLTRWQ